MGGGSGEMPVVLVAVSASSSMTRPRRCRANGHADIHVEPTVHVR